MSPRLSISRNSGRREYFVYIGLCSLWILQLLVISPRGNFPLNDDWLHSRTIFDYITTGRWFYPPYLSAFNFVPIILGVVISKLFGFSFLFLRLTNLVLVLLSVTLLYKLLRFRGTSITLSILAVL